MLTQYLFIYKFYLKIRYLFYILVLWLSFVYFLYLNYELLQSEYTLLISINLFIL